MAVHLQRLSLPPFPRSRSSYPLVREEWTQQILDQSESLLIRVTRDGFCPPGRAPITISLGADLLGAVLMRTSLRASIPNPEINDGLQLAEICCILSSRTRGYMFEQAGIDTKVNLVDLVCEQLIKQNESRAGSVPITNKMQVHHLLL